MDSSRAPSGPIKMRLLEVSRSLVPYRAAIASYIEEQT